MCLILQLVWFIVSLREMFCGDYNDTISCGVVFFKLNAFLPSESSCEMLGIVPHSALIGCYDVECLHHILLPRPFAPFIEASNNVDGGTIVNIVLWIKTRSKKIDCSLRDKHWDAQLNQDRSTALVLTLHLYSTDYIHLQNFY